jgi:cytidylate kinase
MSKQVIISIGREFGSGGHVIAEKLAEKYGLKLYDKNIINDIAKEMNVDTDELEKFDEIPRNRLFSRTVSGYSNSPQEVIAQMQFDFLKKKAESGESFVVVGRCAESVLKDYDGLISIFVTGNMAEKTDRIMKLYNLTEDEANTLIAKTNKARKSYHNYYCKGKWGDSRNYELVVNTSKIGVDASAEIIADYIDCVMNK